MSELDPQMKERIKKAWRIIKAFVLKLAGADYQIEKEDP